MLDRTNQTSRLAHHSQAMADVVNWGRLVPAQALSVSDLRTLPLTTSTLPEESDRLFFSNKIS